MSRYRTETVQKFVVVEADTDRQRGCYFSQAPATALANSLSRGGAQINVEKRTYVFEKSEVIRVSKNGIVI